MTNSGCSALTLGGRAWQLIHHVAPVACMLLPNVASGAQYIVRVSEHEVSSSRQICLEKARLTWSRGLAKLPLGHVGSAPCQIAYVRDPGSSQGRVIVSLPCTI